MKHILLVLSFAAMLPVLSSCTTYVDGGYATTRPVYRPAPAYGYRPAAYTSTRFYSNNRYQRHDHDRGRDYHRVSKPRGRWTNSNANVRVQTNTVRLNTNAGLRL